MNSNHNHDYPFISEPINVKKFLESASAVVAEVENPATHHDVNSIEEYYAKRTGCSTEIAKELMTICDPSRLCADQVIEAVDWKIPLEAEKELSSLKIQALDLEKRKDQGYRQSFANFLKYKRTNFKVLDGYRDAGEAEPSVSYVPNDVILTVVITKPRNRPMQHHEQRLGRLLSMDSAFYVLGSQLLTELCDCISCISDWSVTNDISDNPDTENVVLAKDVYKSRFFFINGTFYNDMRDENATDISLPVCEWAERRGPEIGVFSKARMDETKFGDLEICLGHPYLYLHQGCCEHLVIFTELRLVSPSDAQQSSDYPLQISLKVKRRVTCCACKIYTAKWVTYSNERLPFDPGFFCDTCFRLFNYDKDGNKIGNFKATPYFDRRVLT